jgi:hypothetical protein
MNSPLSGRCSLGVFGSRCCSSGTPATFCPQPPAFRSSALVQAGGREVRAAVRAVLEALRRVSLLAERVALLDLFRVERRIDIPLAHGDSLRVVIV